MVVLIRRSYLGDEGIGIAATVVRLNRMSGGREIDRTRGPVDVHVSEAIDPGSGSHTVVLTASAQVAGKDESRSRGIQLDSEGVRDTTSIFVLERICGRGEVGRTRCSRHVGVTFPVNAHSASRLFSAPTKIGGVD